MENWCGGRPHRNSSRPYWCGEISHLCDLSTPGDATLALCCGQQATSRAAVVEMKGDQYQLNRKKRSRDERSDGLYKSCRSLELVLFCLRLSVLVQHLEWKISTSDDLPESVREASRRFMFGNGGLVSCSGHSEQTDKHCDSPANCAPRRAQNSGYPRAGD
ncbi:hypothetical protein RRG08_002684 [Elysia crispata]|uniref:Uncharacterized protein n=1 Tax=Elysia crispata TaxID=231223 RepID=A0AAE0XTV9_9GAST|nr:hypothetical protein RRG08_002684 [Elysia crispata]